MPSTTKSAIDDILDDPTISLNRFERRVLQSIRKKNFAARDTESEFNDTRRPFRFTRDRSEVQIF